MIRHENIMIEAEHIARYSHFGQVDKAGQPYILHVERVVDACTHSLSKTVAWLHDVVEDSDFWTLGRLYNYGFPEYIIYPLDCITRRKGEGYGEYIGRVAINGISTEVKLADLTDNLRRDRIAQPTQNDHLRWHIYETAKRYLESVKKSQKLIRIEF